MLGIILWLIVIFIIACFANPGFFTFLLIELAIVFPLYFLIFYLADKASDRRARRKSDI